MFSKFKFLLKNKSPMTINHLTLSKLKFFIIKITLGIRTPCSLDSNLLLPLYFKFYYFSLKPIKIKATFHRTDSSLEMSISLSEMNFIFLSASVVFPQINIHRRGDLLLHFQYAYCHRIPIRLSNTNIG